MKNLKKFDKQRKTKQIVNSIFFLLLLFFGWIYFSSFGYIIIGCMAGGIAIAIITSGRKWCNWYCPRGCFFDIIVSSI